MWLHELTCQAESWGRARRVVLGRPGELYMASSSLMKLDLFVIVLRTQTGPDYAYSLISASGSPAASAFIQARQRSRE